MCELSPWLLLGMLISGVLHVALPKNFVRRKFRGFGGVVQSVLLGVPLPLCSCGVIPAGIGLKNDGASDGASVGFLISTPQTGVDSVLVSASFFGWPFAIFKMLAATIMGFFGGFLTEVTDQQVGHDLERCEVREESSLRTNPWWTELWSHAMEVLQSIWLWLLIGVAVSALIGALGFESAIRQIGDWGLFPAMLLMLIIAIPIYVCATASVPIAAAFVSSGLPAAVALVFLMAGPATNLTTMGAVKSRFGWRVLLIYLGTLVIGSFIAAFLFEWVLGATIAEGHVHGHHHQTWWSVLSSIVVLLLIARIVLRRWFKVAQVKDGSTLEVSVGGLHCGSCVNRVETAVGQLPGVDSVCVDLGNGVASVSGKATVDEITSVIEELGFEVAK